MIVQLYLLRILAILLIVNSHLRTIWPLPQLAFGGHLGNSLFYFLSGFGLTLSHRRKPLAPIAWYRRRFSKIVVSLVVICGVLSLGDLQRFLDYIGYELIWHTRAQLEAFLPVLWLLYLVFPWLIRLGGKQKLLLASLVLAAAFILFQLRIRALTTVPTNLPSQDIFFTFNGLVCFLLGMLSAENRGLLDRVMDFGRGKVALLSFLVVIGLQILHRFVHSHGHGVIYLNFYLNFLSVLGLYLLFMSLRIDPSPFHSSIKAIAASSLAVYLVHPRVIATVGDSQLTFPFSVIVVFVSALLLGYALQTFVAFLGKSIDFIRCYRSSSPQ